jgi:predicted nucleotidyltransferase
MILSALLDQLPSILSEFPGISLVYLFGSQVNGQVGPMSDYDLAILDESGQDELEIQTQFQHAVSKCLDNERVDVVLIKHVPIEMAYQIIANGKLLFQRSLYTRVEFESQVLGKYGDYLPTLRSFQQQILHGDPHGKRVQRYREALRRTQRTLGEIGTSS